MPGVASSGASLGFVGQGIATPGCLGVAAWLGGLSQGLPAARVPILDDVEAWRRLPAAIRGAGKPLPVWARALARTLPRTTAALLELDHAHRCRSHLDPLLRGQIRWVAAHANGCRYSQAYAAADLRRAGLDEAGLRALGGDPAQFPQPHRAALAFARKLSRNAGRITDAEVAHLIERYGNRSVVAIVLLVAYARFQDRLLLALALPPEPDGPLPPLDVRFERPALGSSRAGPSREQGGEEAGPAPPAQAVDAEWQALDFGGVSKALARQQDRQSRLNLPGDGGAIRWGLVCSRYQPGLAAAWARCAQAFGEEADQDPVFEQSLFWVVSRTAQCFY
jgi:alkylhydroperoxidase family enzyme